MPAALHFFRTRAISLVAPHDSGWHAHRAVQVAVALDGPFLFADEQGERTVYEASTEPMQRHRVRGGGGMVAYLFFDPGPHAWQRWRAAGGGVSVTPPTLRERLHRLHAGKPEAAEPLARDWCAAVWPGLGVAGPEDPRLARALAALEADPLAPWTHQSLAALAHLSPSRFQTLFRASTGLPVRNYLLWRRLLRATELLQQGHDVTSAAHAAGFADTAHLSRSFRRIIGAAPSAVVSRSPTSVR